MPTKLNVTELDYDKIRSNLKAYFTRPGSVFSDWDFEGSGLSNLLDVLAYNTHYNAMLAHMTLNEGFIDTAQLRESVVSHAKLLGYNPRSKRASSGEISVFFPASTQATPKLSLPRGTKFATVLNGTEYIFITNESTVASKRQGNNGVGYYFTELGISQGILKRDAFLVDESLENQKFIIEDLDVDISTLKVFVRDNIGSTSINVFSSFNSLESTNSTSRIYFISENYNGRYEITFGDGIVGKKVENTQVVELEYFSTLGSEANGAGGRENSIGNWTYVTGAIESEAINTDEATIIVTTKTCSGGGDKEGIESIRFNAPISFISQNRAVTANDYISLIQKEFGAVDAINVWGGEDNDPVTPSGAGKVYISIKPADDITESGEIVTRSKLSTIDKQKILSILDTKRIITLKNQFVDPDYTNIYMDVFVKFNPSKTSLTAGELKSEINSRVVSTYRENELQKFNGVFRYSKFLSSIDNFDPSILNSFARIYLYKKYDNTAFEWSNIKSIVERIEYVPGNLDTDDKIIFHTFEDLDLVTGMTVTAFNLLFTQNDRKGSLENKTITVETDYSFSITGIKTDPTANVSFPDLISSSFYPLEIRESTTIFGDVWINRACDFSPNTIDFSNGLFRGQDKQYPLLECGTWEYTYRAESGYPTEVVADGIQRVPELDTQTFYNGAGKGLIPGTYVQAISGNGTGGTVTFTVNSSGSISEISSYTEGSGYTAASIDTSGLLYFPAGQIIGDAGGAALDTISFTGNTQGFLPGSYIIPVEGNGQGASLEITVNYSGSITSIKVLERGENYTFTSPIDFDQIDKSELTSEEKVISTLNYVGSKAVTISRTSNTVTVTGTSNNLNNHGYVIGDIVTITNAAPDGYNGEKVITGINANTFSYAVPADLGSITDSTATIPAIATVTTRELHGYKIGQKVTISGVQGTSAGLYNISATVLKVDSIGTSFNYSVSGVTQHATIVEGEATTVLDVIDPITISGRNPSEGLLVSTNAKFNISVLEKVADSLSGKVKLVDEAIEDSQSSSTYGKRNVYLINPDLSVESKTFGAIAKSSLNVSTMVKEETAITITSMVKVNSSSDGTTTVTLSSDHGYVVNDTVLIQSVGGAGASSYNGVRTITTIPTGNTFTFTAGSTSAVQPTIPTSGTLATSKIFRALVTLDSDIGHGYLVGQSVTIVDVGGTSETSYNGARTITSLPTGKSLKFTIPASVSTIADPTITSGTTKVTNGNAIVLSSGPSHGFSIGEKLTIGGVGGASASSYNGIRTVTAVGPTKFVFNLGTGTAPSNDPTIVNTSVTATRVTNNVYGFTGSSTKIPVGKLDVSRGIISLTKPITNIPLSETDILSGSTFRINAVPDSNDIAPKRNQILDIDLRETNISVEVDTIATGGSSGSINYTTFKKNRNSDDDKTVIN